jgi:predicted acetyltransferase
MGSRGDGLQVRQVEAAELTAYQTAKIITFLESPNPTPARVDYWQRTRVPGRSWCVSDGPDIVATLRTLARHLSVPAGSSGTADVALDALTGVTVSATHRRRGLLRAMITESLAAAQERGDPVAGLIAAQWPIYGRFGYAPAAQFADGRLDLRRPGARLRTPSSGTLRRVELDELRRVAPAIYAAARTARAGHIDRTELDWERHFDPALHGAGGPPPVAVVHEGADGIDGFLRWHPTAEFTLHHGGRVQLDELFAANQDAYSSLWGYLLGLDVVDEVRFHTRPLDEPLPWLLEDGRTWQLTEVVDAIWLRLLDVPAALSARGYAGSGRLVLDVVDDAPGGYATGRYLLDAAPDGVECRRAPELTPDLALSQRALASVYLGQPSLRPQQLAGLVDELTPGAIARADLVLATPLLPWVGTEF